MLMPGRYFLETRMTACHIS
jgi:hypothetical protein